MAIKVTINTKALKELTDNIEALKEPLKRKDWADIGKSVVSAMKQQIAKGISPIKGNGRFPAYKAAADADRKKSKQGYPYSVQPKYPDKKPRPVNLWLEGDFIRSLRSTPHPNKVEIDFASELSDRKEEGHREGVGGQPKRPIIPLEGSETFSGVVTEEIENIVEDALQKQLDKFKD